MKKIIFITLLCCALNAFGQNAKPVTVIDFVKVKNNKWAEALFYYENNWKIYRDAALQKGYIISYKLLVTKADSASNFDILFMTEYADSLQFKLREENFQPIIKEIRPNGPILLNDIKPADFRQSLYSKEAQTFLSSDINLIKRKE